MLRGVAYRKKISKALLCLIIFCAASPTLMAHFEVSVYLSLSIHLNQNAASTFTQMCLTLFRFSLLPLSEDNVYCSSHSLTLYDCHQNDKLKIRIPRSAADEVRRILMNQRGRMSKFLCITAE